MSDKNYGPHFIGNVIRILSPRSIIVNVGSDILSVNDKIQVYELGPELIDLDGSALCNYEFIKDELDVTRVDAHFAVCSKNKAVKKAGSFTLALSPLLAGQITEYEDLNVSEEEIQPLQIKDPVIHIGDPVKFA